MILRNFNAFTWDNDYIFKAGLYLLETGTETWMKCQVT